MLNKFLNILFPEICPVCKKPAIRHYTAPICFGCWQAILHYKGHKCQRCGKPLVSDISSCGDCIEDEPVFRSAVSFGLYEGALKKAINLFKYHRVKRLAKPLSDKILQTELPRADIIIPVSLHSKRLRQREFNQSALLARHVAKSLRIPLLADCLIKTRDTLPQVGLRAKDRRKNIRKAFEVRNRDLIYRKNIMLVDDVYTTGATVRECSKALKKAGAEDVYVITISHSRGD